MSGFPFQRPFRRTVLAVLCLMSALLVAGPLVAQAGQHGHPPRDCLRGGEMRRAVSAGEAKPLGAIMRRIGGGEVVRALLCRGRGGLVYRVAVLQGSHVEELIIDARSGRVIRRR